MNQPKNIRAGTISTFVSQQLNLNIIHPFCKRPFNFIQIKNIKNSIKNFNVFIKELQDEINKLESFWEQSGKITKNSRS